MVTEGTMGLPPESAVLNFVIRMVVPMRREFGRSLDVQRFMRDADYARAVLDEALASRDQRLRDYAEYVQRHLGGAREVNAPPVPPLAATAVGHDTVPASFDAAVPPAAGSAEPTEAELRERMLRKYTGGLR
jgi:hypothetical protein